MKIVNFIRYRIRKFLMQEITLDDYIKRGMKVGENCAILDGSTFDYGHCNLITIGNNVTIAPQAYLLAHDASTKRILGYTKIGKIVIGDNVFIGARALIMPGVTVGEGCIVGAGSVVVRDIPPNVVVAGSPAKLICTKDEYIEKNRELMRNTYVFNKEYTFNHSHFDTERQKEIQDKVLEKICFLE